MFKTSLFSWLLIGLVAWCSPALAQIGTPTTYGTNSVTGGSATSLVIPFIGAASVGNLVGIACSSYTLTTVKQVTITTDSAGNTYTLSSGSSKAGGSTLYYSLITNPIGGGASVTATFPALSSSDYVICDAFLVTGANATTPEDTGAGKGIFFSTGQPSITSNALATTNELIIGMQDSFGGATSTLTYTEASGFTTLYSARSATQVGGGSGDYVYSSLSYKLVTPTTAVTWSPTYNTTPTDGFSAVVSAFEGNGSPPSTVICTITLLGAGPC